MNDIKFESTGEIKVVTLYQEVAGNIWYEATNITKMARHHVHVNGEYFFGPLNLIQDDPKKGVSRIWHINYNYLELRKIITKDDYVVIDCFNKNDDEYKELDEIKDCDNCNKRAVCEKNKTEAGNIIDKLSKFFYGEIYLNEEESYDVLAFKSSMNFKFTKVNVIDHKIVTTYETDLWMDTNMDLWIRIRHMYQPVSWLMLKSFVYHGEIKSNTLLN
jgi:hypothetical protein